MEEVSPPYVPRAGYHREVPGQTPKEGAGRVDKRTEWRDVP